MNTDKSWSTWVSLWLVSMSSSWLEAMQHQFLCYVALVLHSCSTLCWSTLAGQRQRLCISTVNWWRSWEQTFHDMFLKQRWLFGVSSTCSFLLYCIITIQYCSYLLTDSTVQIISSLEDCEGWWSSGCRGSVAEHWWLKPEVSWVWLQAVASLFTFLYFRLITSFISSLAVKHDFFL